MLCVRHFLKVGGWFKQQKQNVWVVLQVACLVLVFPAFLYGNAFAWMRSTCTTICRPIQKSDKRDQLETICTIQIGFLVRNGFRSTVRILHNFSITQILREISFWEFRRSKTAVFAIFGTLHFGNLENISLQKVQIF